MTQLPVQGYLYSSDRLFDATFDAEPWFEQASDDEIVALAKTGFGKSDEADEVALFMEDKSSYVAKVFDYTRATQGGPNPQGFQVEIDPNAATAWIQKHRSHLVEQFEEQSE